ncbi:hypothetical protein BLOT_013962, partial [Blomia tropicalis]
MRRHKHDTTRTNVQMCCSHASRLKYSERQQQHSNETKQTQQSGSIHECMLFGPHSPQLSLRKQPGQFPQRFRFFFVDLSSDGGDLLAAGVDGNDGVFGIILEFCIEADCGSQCSFICCGGPGGAIRIGDC